MKTVNYGTNGDIYSNTTTGVKQGIWDRILATLASKNGMDLDSYVELINSTQRAHRAMRVKYGAPDESDKWTAGNSDVTSYLDLIKKNFSFVNDPGVKWGFDQTGNWRYVIPEGANTGDNPEKGWVSEGVWGAINDTRRVLGRVIKNRDGQWVDDYTQDEKNNMNDKLKQYNLTMVLEADPNDPNVQYYVLKKLNGGTGGGGGQQLQGGGKGTNWRSIWFGKQDTQKEPAWTDWLPLTQNLAHETATDARIGRYERLKAFPLKEAKWHNYKVTDDYFTRQMLKGQATEARDRGYNQFLTSDLRANTKQQMAYEDRASELEQKAAGYKSQRYYQDRDKALAVANGNTDEHVDIRNENAQTLAAKFNSILSSKAAQLEKWKKSLNSYVTNMYTNAGEYMKMKRINAAKRIKSGLESALTNAQTKAQEIYDDFQNTLFKGQNREILYNYLNSMRDRLPKGYEDKTDLLNETLDHFDANANTIAGQQKILDFVKTISPEGTAWLESMTKKRETDYKNAMWKANTAYQQGIANLPAMYSNQLWDNHPFAAQYGTDPIFGSQYMKQGGKTTKVDRLSDYYKLYQREQESVRNDARKRNQDLTKDLNKALDRISKEELLLLRSVFK